MTSLSDQRARERAATAMDRNVVVTAGAGTGKTTLLVDRLTHLLFRRPDPLPIGGIVALTFTNKAANEMKLRLHDRLRLWVTMDPSDPPGGPGLRRECEQMADIHTRYGLDGSRLRELAQAALRDLEKSQLGTIHSFAAHLLRLYPQQSGVDPEFVEDDGSRFADHVEREWRLWLDEELAPDGAGHAAWRAALAHVSIEEIRELAVCLCSELVPLDTLSESLAWERSGGAAPEVIRRWAARLRDQASGLRLSHQKTNTVERMLDTAIARLDLWAGEDRLSTEARALPPDLNRSVPPKTTSWTKEDHAAAKAVIESTKRLVQADMTPLAPLLARLIGFAGTCRQRFVDSGCVSFDGLLARARDLLRDHPDVRRALKHQFRAILVDEFQDTDPVQYELVLFLAEAENRDAPRWQEVRLEPGKLFVVGDPKQSIYAFRRADMEAYDRVIDGVVLADGAFGEPQVLQTNFRSHAGLLAPVNACFSRLFPADALKGLQPKNEPLVPVLSAAAANPHEGLLVRLVRPKDAEADAETATRCEAESLAHWLSEEVFGRRQLQEGDVSVTVQPRHVGILLRTLTVAREYVEALRRHRIPYVTEGEKHFFERQEVIDLGNLLCACLTPHDQIALAAVLRSALGGLTDRELEQLVSAGRLDFRRDPPTGLSSAERLYRLLRDLHHTLLRLPVTEGLEYLFDRVPVMELAAAWQDGEQAVANVKKLRTLLIQAGEQSGASWRTVVRRLRGWFLDRPDEAESPLAEEGTEALDQEGAVRVLSIHKAKGLEFPMVILAGLHRGTDRREDRITVHQDWSTGLVGVQVGAWRTVGAVYLGAKLSERQRAEERRVLYVAMTRAKRRLVLSAGLPTTRSSRGEGGLALVSEGWGVDLPECRPGPIQVGGVSVPVEVAVGDDIPLARSGLDAAWASETAVTADQDARWDAREAGCAAAHEVPRFLTATGLQAGRALPHAGYQSDEGFYKSRGGPQTGILAHRLLEGWDFTRGIEQLEDEHTRGWLMAVDCPLADELRSILGTFVRSAIYPELQRAEILGREVPLMIPWTAGATPSSAHRPQSSVMQGVVDLLFRLDGRIWIADYKTDRIEGTEVRARAETYRPQSEAYQAGVRQALGVPSVRFQFLFLRAGQVVEM